MSTTDLMTIALVVVSLLGVLVAWVTYKYGKGKDQSVADDTRIKGMIAEQLKPILDMHASINNRLDNLVEAQKRQGHESRDMNDKLLHVIEQQARMATQIEVFWKDVGMEAAKVVHSPDPARAHIDRLIDALREGVITDEESTELKRYLVQIRDWEPGRHVDFPVYPGEQFAAGVLLQTMDHIRGSDRGHNAK